MKITIAFILCLLISTKGYSQHEKYSLEFGKVTQHEMIMTEYENDSNADAVMLYNQGRYRFAGDHNKGQFYLRMTRQMKIKILKQSGIQYANFEIPYYKGNQDWEIIEEIKGTTYNIDNGFKQTSLESKNIFEEQLNENVNIKKIAFPDVRPGSVIEISYTIVTPYYFNMREWYFQQRIPVIYSNLQYDAIPYYEYTFILKGSDKLDIFTSKDKSEEIHFGNLVYKERTFNFGMKDLPAFKDEEFITSIDDHMMNINFQISKIHFPRGGTRQVMTTWPEMCDDFLKNDYFGKYIDRVEKQASRIMDTLDVSKESNQRKVELISDFVKTKYTWDGINSKMAEVQLKDFLRSQTGSSGNINLLMLGLLKSVGIEAYPIILSTRGNGLISLEHPFQQFFNYVIVMAVIDDKVVLLDGTDPLLNYTVLPEKCMNVYGLVVKPKSEEWITIQQQNKSLSQKILTIKIEPETSNAKAEVIQIATGPAAHRLRTIYQGNTENLKNYIQGDLDINAKDVNVTYDAVNKPFTFYYVLDKSVENISDKLFIDPFCNLSLDRNPFSQSERTLPVDLVYLREEVYKSIIEIPEGYQVEHLPERVSIDNDVLTFDYEVSNYNNRITVDAKYQFNKFIIPADQYELLKSNFNTMIKSFSDMIILSKENLAEDTVVVKDYSDFVHIKPRDSLTAEELELFKKLEEVVYGNLKVENNKFKFVMEKDSFLSTGIPEEYYDLLMRNIEDNNCFYETEQHVEMNLDSLWLEIVKEYELRIE